MAQVWRLWHQALRASYMHLAMLTESGRRTQSGKAHRTACAAMATRPSASVSVSPARARQPSGLRPGRIRRDPPEPPNCSRCSSGHLLICSGMFGRPDPLDSHTCISPPRTLVVGMSASLRTLSMYVHGERDPPLPAAPRSQNGESARGTQRWRGDLCKRAAAERRRGQTPHPSIETPSRAKGCTHRPELIP